MPNKGGRLGGGTGEGEGEGTQNEVADRGIYVIIFKLDDLK